MHLCTIVPVPASGPSNMRSDLTVDEVRSDGPRLPYQDQGCTLKWDAVLRKERVVSSHEA